MTDERVKGMGDWLIEVHDWFRAELATLRRQAAAGEQLTPATGCAPNWTGCRPS